MPADQLLAEHVNAIAEKVTFSHKSVAVDSTECRSVAVGPTACQSIAVGTEDGANIGHQGGNAQPAPQPSLVPSRRPSKDGAGASPARIQIQTTPSPSAAAAPAAPGDPGSPHSFGRCDLFAADNQAELQKKEMRRRQAQMLAEQVEEQRKRKEDEKRKRQEEEQKEEQRIEKERRDMEARYARERGENPASDAYSASPQKKNLPKSEKRRRPAPVNADGTTPQVTIGETSSVWPSPSRRKSPNMRNSHGSGMHYSRSGGSALRSNVSSDTLWHEVPPTESTWNQDKRHSKESMDITFTEGTVGLSTVHEAPAQTHTSMRRGRRGRSGHGRDRSKHRRDEDGVGTASSQGRERSRRRRDREDEEETREHSSRRGREADHDWEHDQAEDHDRRRERRRERRTRDRENRQGVGSDGDPDPEQRERERDRDRRERRERRPRDDRDHRHRGHSGRRDRFSSGDTPDDDAWRDWSQPPVRTEEQWHDESRGLQPPHQRDRSHEHDRDRGDHGNERDRDRDHDRDPERDHDRPRRERKHRSGSGTQRSSRNPTRSPTKISNSPEPYKQRQITESEQQHLVDKLGGLMQDCKDLLREHGIDLPQDEVTRQGVHARVARAPSGSASPLTPSRRGQASRVNRDREVSKSIDGQSELVPIGPDACHSVFVPIDDNSMVVQPPVKGGNAPMDPTPWSDALSSLIAGAGKDRKADRPLLGMDNGYPLQGRPNNSRPLETSPFVVPNARGMAVARRVGGAQLPMSPPHPVSRGGINLQAPWPPFGRLADWSSGSSGEAYKGHAPIGINSSLQAQSAMLQELFPQQRVVDTGGGFGGPMYY
eukprot:gnl/MRDRNA2_/MRDRNA2_114243_c0_seq1.p1 gnl/MRDRNA2_/MRDRNA2_114243_c0~~gnl/MRDRNA2_/MRDRNA2_114243_c0_seq1.p1  ORF type:complete len:827 (-),score=158.07 gnl/MRDRNA2_/MRDRNA2_114243_c0_seq1:53-2533(-)